MRDNNLAAEWTLLQGQYHSYEAYSLLIKLASVAVLVFSMLVVAVDGFAALVIAILWLQDAIWKTYQSRIECRLMNLEKALADPAQEEVSAFQLHTQFSSTRAGGAALLIEYLRQAIRPTIAYPYVALLIVSATRIML